jgi:hypothetical protein
VNARRWWPLIAVAVLLLAVAGASAVSSPQLTRIPVPDSTFDAFPDDTGEATGQAATEVPTPEAQPARTSVPGWVGPLLIAVLLCVVLGLLATAIWLVVRGRTRYRQGRLDEPAQAPAPAAAEQVVAAVDAGLSDLSDSDLDPRRAVIACWVRLEQVAAGAGTPRQPADTPTDLVTRLLAAHHVEPGVLAAFADIYRLARYATHTVDEQMRGQARSALERLRAELTGVTV